MIDGTNDRGHYSICNRYISRNENVFQYYNTKKIQSYDDNDFFFLFESRSHGWVGLIYVWSQQKVK